MKKEGNYIGELADYIKRNLRKGYTKDSLKWALVGQGHSRLEVEKAVKKVELELAREAPILNTKPSIKYELVEPKPHFTENKKSFWKIVC